MSVLFLRGFLRQGVAQCGLKPVTPSFCFGALDLEIGTTTYSLQYVLLWFGFVETVFYIAEAVLKLCGVGPKLSMWF